MNGRIMAVHSLGSATADWQPEVLKCTGVKLGLLQQNSDAAECGSTWWGSDLAVLAWAVKDILTPAMVVARYGPFNSAGVACGLLSRQFARMT